jgi:hypothetical protein
MMAYLTPTVGLGCRSGSYLIYGVAATISWALFISSSLLSHAVALRYQGIYTGRSPFPRKDNRDIENAGIPLMTTEEFGLESDPVNLSVHQRTSWHSILAFLAVFTRLTGKLIAAVNSCWIVLSAIFEYTGVYNNCWCETDADVLGSRAWATIFLTPQALATVSRSYWVGGVIFSFGVCFFAYVGFYLGCKRSDDDDKDDG